MKQEERHTIAIWSGLSESHQDQKTHFWYNDDQERTRRLCDNLETFGDLHSPAPTRILIPCKPCQELYTEDIAFGRGMLEHSQLPAANQPMAPDDFMVYSHKNWGYPHQIQGDDVLEIPPIGMATFARFYDAPVSGRLKVINDARTYLANHDGYKQRSYYWALRNTLLQTHWATNDLSSFADAREGMLLRQKIEHRKDNYQTISQAYLSFFKKTPDARLFRIPPTRIEIAGLTIIVNPDIGMRLPGNDLALKLWLSSKPPKNNYRQAIQYLMQDAQQGGWREDLQPAIWDIRRERIMQPVKIPNGFDIVIGSQAAAFRYMWESANIGAGGWYNEDGGIDLPDA